MKKTYPGTGIILGRYTNPVHGDGPLYLRLKNNYGITEDLKRKKITLFEEEFIGQESSHIWTIDKSAFLMKNSIIDYPVAVGRNGDTPDGEFIVAELWENPYWKNGNGKIYLPGDSNPIGDFLVILADPVSGEKINQFIHKWLGYPVSRKEFRPGNRTEGCITLNASCMDDFKRRVKLADRVIIEKGNGQYHSNVQRANNFHDFSKMHLDDPGREKRIIEMISEEGQMAMCA